MKKDTPVKYEKVEAVSLSVSNKRNLKPKIYGGFNALKTQLKVLISILASIFIVASGAFVATAPANAGALEDWTCDSYRTNVWKDYGAGSTNNAPEINITNLFGELVDTTSANTKLTAYEVYGTAGANYTTWYSVDRENIGTHTYAFMLPNSTEPLKDNGGGVPKPGGEGDAAEKNLNPYWANNWMDCTGITGAIGNGIANYMLGITKVGTVIVNFTYSIAVDGYKFAITPIWDVVNSTVITLNEALYLPFIVVFIMFGALWLAWVGLVKKRSTEAFQGAIWMIGSTIAGIMLIANPTFIPNLADDIVGKTTEVATSVITDAGNKTNNNNVLCSIDAGANNLKYVDEKNNDLGVVSASSRKMQCAIWYNLVYTPWVVGQFGVSPTSTASGSEYLIGTKANPDTASGKWVQENKDKYKIRMGQETPIPTDSVTWPLIQLNAQAINSNIIKPTDAVSGNQYWMSSVAFVAYQELAAQENTTWNGANPFNRITTANTAVIAMLFTAVLVLIFSIMMIIYQLTMLLLILMMPFFLLVGAQPGYGRRIATRWAELIINLTIKRMVIAVLLAVFLMFYGIIMSTSTIWLLQNILIAAITIVGLIYRGKITDIFASVDFGGDKSLGANADGRPSLVKKLSGAMVGAGVGALGAKVGLSSMKPSEALVTGAVKGVQPNVKATNNVSGTQTKAAIPVATPAGAINNTTANATVAQNGAINQNGITSANNTPTAVLPTTRKLSKVEEAKNAAASRVQRETVEEQVAKRNAEVERQQEAKRKAIRGAAAQGAAQGFATGVKGSLGAAMVGYQIGDGAYDNEVQQQQNEALRAQNKADNNNGTEELPPEVVEAIEQEARDEEDFFTALPITEISENKEPGKHGSGVYSNKEETNGKRAIPRFEVQNAEEAHYVKQQQEIIRTTRADNERLADRAKLSGALGDAARKKIVDNEVKIDTAREDLKKFQNRQPMSLPPRQNTVNPQTDKS